RERVFPFSRLRVSIVAEFRYFGDEKSSSKSRLIFFYLSKSLIVSAIKPKEPLMFQTLIHSPSSSFSRNQFRWIWTNLRSQFKDSNIMDPPDKDPDPDTLKLSRYPIRPMPIP
ncbi:hypothetical protein IGI04_031429, partial [Brassica rapa subsp. trilocularis]